MATDTLLEELLASSKRIEALLVTLVGKPTAGPPGWARRFGQEESTMTTVEGIIAGDVTPEQAVESAKEQRQVGGPPNGN